MNPDAPQAVAVEVPAPPEHLDADERRVWVALAPRVSAMRTATESDLIAFELLVGDVAFAYRVSRDTTASVNQRVAARRQAWAALAHFGLSPATRPKVSQVGAAAEDDDELAEFVQ